MNEQVRIALPSKGRMEGETLEFLANCGLRVNKTNPRQYTATIPALPGVMVMFMRPRDIPVSVASGDMDLGITGYDTVYDAFGGETEELMLVHEALDYGQCALVLAVPTEWTEVHTVQDLTVKATQQELRVATKYRNSVDRFLTERNIAGIRVVSADGALEAAPSIGYADFIADITSSGTTLRENNLRSLEDGLIVDSQAVLIGNRTALATRPAVMAATEQLLEFIEAYMNAHGKYMIFANMRGETLDEVAHLVLGQPDLGGLQWPTISPLGTQAHHGNWWSVSIVVSHSRLYPAIQQFRTIGGSGVVVTPVSYIFEERPERCRRLLSIVQGVQP